MAISGAKQEEEEQLVGTQIGAPITLQFNPRRKRSLSNPLDRIEIIAEETDTDTKTDFRGSYPRQNSLK